MFAKRHAVDFWSFGHEGAYSFPIKVIDHLAKYTVKNDAVVESAVSLVGGNSINLSKRLKAVAGQVGPIFTRPFEGVNEGPLRHFESSSLEFGFEKKFVESVVVVSNKNDIGWAELKKGDKGIVYRRCVRHHFVCDAADSGRFWGNRALRIGEGAKTLF